MDKCYYLCEWGKDKARSWSGTNLGLYNALSKDINIEDINLDQYTKTSTINRILRKFGLVKYDLNYELLKKRRRFLDEKLKTGKIIQFEEILCNSKERETYIYLDLSVQYIWDLMHNDSSLFEASGFNRYSISSIKGRLESQNEYFKNASGVFTMGQWMADDLIRRNGLSPDRVHHVGGGINVFPELIERKPKENNKILFIGRDFERKGGAIVGKAFQELRKRGRNVELYVAGPQTDPLQALTDENYHFLGDCDKEKISNLLNKCDIFVMPSYFEAYGLVFIEALTYGLPCIARDRYEMPFFIENGTTGYLLEEDDETKLADMIDDLLSNVQIKKNVEDRFEFYNKEYSWQTVADRIKKIIV